MESEEGNPKSPAVRILDVEVSQNPDRCCGRAKAASSLTCILHP